MRTTDKPTELMRLYEEKFAALEERFDNSTRATVIQKFLDKVSDREPLPQAYFQYRLGKIRLYQDRIKEALELEEAAYSKIKALPLSNAERPLKLSIMRGLAEVLEMLQRYMDEISLREEIVYECEHYLPDDIDLIIIAKENLVKALEHGDRRNKAFDVRKQIVEALDGRKDEEYIREANNFANVLEENGDYESSLTIRRTIVALCEKNDYEHTHLIWAFNRIIATLEKFPDEEHLEEKVEMRYRQYMTFSEEVQENTSSYVIEELAENLKQLGRQEEAQQVLKRLADISAHQAENLQRHIDDLKYRIESIEKPDIETVKLMLEILNLMEKAKMEQIRNRYFCYESQDNTEKENWEEKINETIRAIIEQTCREPIADYDAAISTLNELLNLRWGGEDISLRQNILVLIEKKPDSIIQEIIIAKKGLVQGLFWKSDLTYKEITKVKRLFEEIEDYYRSNLPEYREDLLDTFRYHAYFFRYKLKNISAVVEKLKESIALFKDDSEKPDSKIFVMLEEIVDMFSRRCDFFLRRKTYPEDLICRELILNFCREHFVENAPEKLRILGDLIRVCKNLENYDKAAQYSKEFIADKEKNLDSSHIDIIEAKEQLADTLHRADKLDDEIKLRQQIIKLYRENFKTNVANQTRYCSNFIKAVDNLATIFDETGKDEEAVAILKQIIPDRKKYLQE